jgi:hypothetical protein
LLKQIIEGNYSVERGKIAPPFQTAAISLNLQFINDRSISNVWLNRRGDLSAAEFT